MIELLGLLFTTLAGVLRSRQRLLVENLPLRQQRQVALRAQRRPRLGTRDKLFWLLVRRLHQDWRCHLLLVRPETVLAWHRQGWRLFWRWRARCPLGRPRLNAEVRALIATMAPATLGVLLFWVGVQRFGLLNTMVFTHLPSNLLLVLVPLAPTAWIAVLLFLARMREPQMDMLLTLTGGESSIYHLTAR